MAIGDKLHIIRFSKKTPKRHFKWNIDLFCLGRGLGLPRPDPSVARVPLPHPTHPPRQAFGIHPLPLRIPSRFTSLFLTSPSIEVREDRCPESAFSAMWSVAQPDCWDVTEIYTDSEAVRRSGDEMWCGNSVQDVDCSRSAVTIHERSVMWLMSAPTVRSSCFAVFSSPGWAFRISWSNALRVCGLETCTGMGIVELNSLQVRHLLHTWTFVPSFSDSQ